LPLLGPEARRDILFCEAKVKASRKASMKKYYESHKEAIFSRVKERKLADPEKYKEISQKSYVAHRQEKSEYLKAYRATHHKVKAAQAMVHRAVKEGRLNRQPCEFCGSLKTDGHHDDYSKPLSVRWMCRRCHNIYHRKSSI
jgi:hypothetical protein